MEGLIAALSDVRQGPARDPCGHNREQAPRHDSGVHQSRAGKSRSEDPPGRQTAHTLHTNWTEMRRLELRRGQDRQNEGGTSSRSELRSLTSPPCPAALQRRAFACSDDISTLRGSDILTWLQHLITREGSTGVPFPPPLALDKRFSRSGHGQIFPLFQRGLRIRLSTGQSAKWPGSGLSGPIFSGSDDCSSLVNRFQASEIDIFFRGRPEHFDGSRVS